MVTSMRMLRVMTPPHLETLPVGKLYVRKGGIFRLQHDRRRLSSDSAFTVKAANPAGRG